MDCLKKSLNIYNPILLALVLELGCDNTDYFGYLFRSPVKMVTLKNENKNCIGFLRPSVLVPLITSVLA